MDDRRSRRPAGIYHRSGALCRIPRRRPHAGRPAARVDRVSEEPENDQFAPLLTLSGRAATLPDVSVAPTKGARAGDAGRVTISEFTFLALGLVLGLASGAALVLVLRARPPARREVRVHRRPGRDPAATPRPWRTTPSSPPAPNRRAADPPIGARWIRRPAPGIPDRRTNVQSTTTASPLRRHRRPLAQRAAASGSGLVPGAIPPARPASIGIEVAIRSSTRPWRALTMGVDRAGGHVAPVRARRRRKAHGRRTDSVTRPIVDGRSQIAPGDHGTMRRATSARNRRCELATRARARPTRPATHSVPPNGPTTARAGGLRSRRRADPRASDPPKNSPSSDSGPRPVQPPARTPSTQPPGTGCRRSTGSMPTPVRPPRPWRGARCGRRRSPPPWSALDLEADAARIGAETADAACTAARAAWRNARSGAVRAGLPAGLVAIPLPPDPRGRDPHVALESGDSPRSSGCCMAIARG